MAIIRLPWPARELSPNARGHWGSKSRFTKAARRDAYWLTEASGAAVQGEGPIPMRITFLPPDKRPRDRDNLIASMKAATDGIADALGVNDRRFEPTYAFGEPVKGGAVEVLISPVGGV